MTWPSSWRENTLRHAEIPVSDFATHILHLWEQSTPTSRWTNNPLGMPSEGFAAPRALNSPYAAFPTMQAFYKAFKTAAHSGNGKPLYTALGTSESYAELWRVINQLEWPANRTETDHPVKLLDQLTDDVHRYLKVKQPSERKTVGVNDTSSSHLMAIRAQSQALHGALSNYDTPSLAIKYIAGALRNHG